VVKFYICVLKGVNYFSPNKNLKLMIDRPPPQFQSKKRELPTKIEKDTP